MRGRVVGNHNPIQIRKSTQLSVQGIFVRASQFEPLPAAKQRSIFEHGNGLWMEGPIGAFAWSVGTPGNLDEAIVKTKVVAKAVLPSLRVLPIVREVIHDEFVDI